MRERRRRRRTFPPYRRRRPVQQAARIWPAKLQRGALLLGHHPHPGLSASRDYCRRLGRLDRPHLPDQPARRRRLSKQPRLALWAGRAGPPRSALTAALRGLRAQLHAPWASWGAFMAPLRLATTSMLTSRRRVPGRDGGNGRWQWQLLVAMAACQDRPRTRAPVPRRGARRTGCSEGHLPTWHEGGGARSSFARHGGARVAPRHRKAALPCFGPHPFVGFCAALCRSAHPGCREPASQARGAPASAPRFAARVAPQARQEPRLPPCAHRAHRGHRCV